MAYTILIKRGAAANVPILHHGEPYWAHDTNTLYIGDPGGNVTIAGGGVSDHGALTGLTDDDHTQYVLRQPAADIVINESGGDFNWRIEGSGDTNLFYLDAGNDAITIGSTTELGKLGIDGNADEIQLTVQAHSTQTTNPFEVQQSDGTVVVSIDTTNKSLTIDTSEIHTFGTQNLYIGGGNFTETGNGINVGVGDDALFSVTTGERNVAMGATALYYNTTGNRNMAVGSLALRDNTEGFQNVAMGYLALTSNTTGDRNIGIGQAAGRYNVTGNNNVCIGETAGNGVSGNSFSDNVFIGMQAGRVVTTALRNVGVGTQSLLDLTTATDCVAIGRLALQNLTSGSRNVAIGQQAGGGVVTGAQNVFIGNLAGSQETGSNTLYIENTNTTTPLIYGEFDNNIVQINGKLTVDQLTTTAAVPVLTLDQADIDLEFIKFIGSSEDGVADRSLVDVADMTTPGALTGWIQIYIEDIQGTNPITDGVYYIPFYAAPSA